MSLMTHLLRHFRKGVLHLTSQNKDLKQFGPIVQKHRTCDFTMKLWEQWPILQNVGAKIKVSCEGPAWYTTSMVIQQRQ